MNKKNIMKWINIKDELPPDNIDIFVRWNEYTYDHVCGRDYYIEAGERIDFDYATHWIKVEHPEIKNE